MANKTNRIFSLALFTLTAAFFLRPLYAQKTLSQTLSIKPIFEVSETEKGLGSIATADGIRWKTLFECETNNPLMMIPETDYYATGSPEQIASLFIHENREIFNLRDMASELSEPLQFKSPGTFHIVYEQKHRDLPVFDSTIGVHIDKNGRLELVTNNLKDLYDNKEPYSQDIGSDKAREIAAANLKGTVRNGRVTLQKGYIQTAQGIKKVWRINYPTSLPPGNWLFDIDAVTGRVYKRVNTLKFVDAQGHIYFPNPKAGVKGIGVSLKNLMPPQNGADFKLDGIFFKVINSRFKEASEKDPVFNYSYIFDESILDESPLSSVHYEEVLVYYLLESTRAYYGDLGFQLFNSFRLKADAHGSDQDTSWYDSARRTIIFGDGGINDASDSDIVLHEFGHAIYDYIKPKHLHMVGETAAMHEGFADYQAATLTDDPCIGEWDSRPYSKSGCLRNLDNKKYYPRDMTGREHDDGELWGGALWDLATELTAAQGRHPGKQIADSLIIKSLYYLPDDSVSFKEGALAILAADSNLYRGNYATIIESVFKERGILEEDRSLQTYSN